MEKEPLLILTSSYSYIKILVHYYANQALAKLIKIVAFFFNPIGMSHAFSKKMGKHLKKGVKDHPAQTPSSGNTLMHCLMLGLCSEKRILGD